MLAEDESARLFGSLAPSNAGRVQMIVYGKLPPVVTPSVAPAITPSKDPVVSIDTLTEDALASAGLGTSLDKVVGEAKTPGKAKLMARGTLNLATDPKGHLVSTDKAQAMAKGLLSKGLVVESQQQNEAGTVEVIPLQADPQPIASRTIRYYTKASAAP